MNTEILLGSERKPLSRDFVVTDETGPDGRVRFEDIQPGAYTVSHVVTDQPPGSELVGSTAQTVVAGFAGDTVVDTRFIYRFQPGSLAGVVFRDDDGSGGFDAGFDSTFAGVAVLAFVGSDTAGTPAAADTTGADGLWSMSGLDAGECDLGRHAQLDQLGQHGRGNGAPLGRCSGHHVDHRVLAYAGLQRIGRDGQLAGADRSCAAPFESSAGANERLEASLDGARDAGFRDALRASLVHLALDQLDRDLRAGRGSHRRVDAGARIALLGAGGDWQQRQAQADHHVSQSHVPRLHRRVPSFTEEDGQVPQKVTPRRRSRIPRAPRAAPRAPGERASSWR